MNEQLESRDYLRRIMAGPSKSYRAADEIHIPSYKQMVVHKIIGQNSYHSLIEFEIDLPHMFPAIELKDTCIEVRDMSLKTCNDRVLVNGTLFCSVNYKTFEGKATLRFKGSSLKAVFGAIKNISASLPFSCIIDIPGTLPCDEVNVEFAGVEASSQSATLDRPYHSPRSNVTLYGSIRERVIVIVDLKVLRQTIVNV